MARKKINQNDLRRLMKERSETVAKEERVESPLAKYDKSGKLSCIACCEEVKIQWRHHILSKKHKENLNKRLKRKNQDDDDEMHSAVPKAKLKTSNSTINEVSLNGRKTANQSEDVSELQKESPKILSQKPPSSTQKTNLIAGYSSSDDDFEEDDDPKNDKGNDNLSSESKNDNKELSDVLPPGFFDAQPTTSTSPSTSSVPLPSHVSKMEKADPSTSKAKSEQDGLPEGFFDDPVQDAKARNVEYKDPMEEEWEKFQKTMAEEANVSRNIMEEDLEKSEIEKDIDQIEQMIFNWSKVNNLQSKKETLEKQLHCTKMDADDENSDDSVVDEDLNYLLDWRATGASKK